MRYWLLIIAGVATLGFAGFHAFLPRIMDWKIDLESLFIGNRKTVNALNIAIVYLLAVMGALTIYLAGSAESLLNQILIWGMAGFWYLRILIQAFVYGYVWKPSYGMTAMFVIMAALYTFAAGL